MCNFTFTLVSRFHRRQPQFRSIWGLEIDSENDDDGIDCDNPETFVGYEGLGCDAASGIQICCVIIPLLLSFVLILSNISPYEEEE